MKGETMLKFIGLGLLIAICVEALIWFAYAPPITTG
jgi:uncharacterized membrane protein YukC